MAFTPFKSSAAKVRVNTTTVVTAKKWTCNYKADKLDVSNFEAGGFYVWIGGLLVCDVTIDFDLDGDAAATNPWDSTIALVPGTKITNARLYLNDTTGPYWDFPSFFVESTNNTGDVKQAAMVSCTGASSGTFTDPTGDLVA